MFRAQSTHAAILAPAENKRSTELKEELKLMAKRLVAVFALFALTFSLTAIGFAQESTVKGNLSGVVTDPSGAVVAAPM